MKLGKLIRLACVVSLAFGVYSPIALSAEPPVESRAMADGIIVKYRSDVAGANLADRVRVAEAAARTSGHALRYGRAGALGIHVLKLDREVSLSEAQELARLIERSDQNVEYAEPDLIVHPTFAPNDPDYPYQWHYFESTGGINLPSAWDSSTGTGVVVAVLDTGYLAHADLAANIVGGYDFISNSTIAGDGDGRDSSALDPGDYCIGNSTWHGTHVAGTIAAVTNNNSGVARGRIRSQDSSCSCSW